MSIPILRRAVLDYLRAVPPLVRTAIRKGQGSDVLGAVAGRSQDEDDEIGIDRACDELLQRHLRASGLRVDIHSEHGLFPVGELTRKPAYLVSVDPFDGSGLFRRKLPAEWWSVLTVYDVGSLAPLLAGAVDILRGEVYMAEKGRVTVTPLAAQRGRPVIPATKTRLDASTIIAAFLMDPTYLMNWTEKANKLAFTLRDKYPKVRIWPNGGSCVYPWLARGLIHAYLMFDEPKSEVHPGLGFASAAGFPVYNVSGGKLTPYAYTPVDEAGRVPCLIAACTPELAREIAGLL